MPTYEYRCQTCGLLHEKVSKIKDMTRQDECPRCHDMAPIIVSKGVTLSDEAAWLNDYRVRGALQDDTEIRRNPEWNRTEYKKVLKEKGIVER
jgi:putative FmdB family regulatory protein